MTDSAAPDKKWVLAKQDWDAFLAQLDDNPEKAGAVYERLRGRLVSFFRCRGFSSAEDHADEAINRMIRAAASEQIREPAAYGLRVARYIASEEHRRKCEVPLNESQELRDMYVPNEDKERRILKQLACIDECAAVLALEDRDLLFSWYRHDKTEKIQEKRQLAANLGIPLGTLRVRAFRIRERVRGCVTGCLARK